MKDLLAKAGTLTEALPWIKAAWGSTVVVKYGGATMTDPVLREMVASDLVLMKLVGINPVIVHGGGPEITSYMERLDMPVEFFDGMRVTDDAAMEVVKMVLVGKVNKELVSAINRHGRLAVGISGDDANLIKARPISARLGRVGEVETIDTTVVTNLIEDGFIPVIATVGYGDDGGSYNINADLVAGRVAAALNAEKLILLTDINGVKDKSGTLLESISVADLHRLIEEDAITGGMIPKVICCADALKEGVKKAHIIDGRMEHAVLLEIFTDVGIGTEITK